MIRETKVISSAEDCFKISDQLFRGAERVLLIKLVLYSAAITTTVVASFSEKPHDFLVFAAAFLLIVCSLLNWKFAVLRSKAERFRAQQRRIEMGLPTRATGLEFSGNLHTTARYVAPNIGSSPESDSRAWFREKLIATSTVYRTKAKKIHWQCVVLTGALIAIVVALLFALPRPSAFVAGRLLMVFVLSEAFVKACISINANQDAVDDVQLLVEDLDHAKSNFEAIAERYFAIVRSAPLIHRVFLGRQDSPRQQQAVVQPEWAEQATTQDEQATIQNRPNE
jgi:hypothetical protein